MRFFERLASWTAYAVGTTTATLLAFGFVLGWFIGGLVHFGFGESYQLVINTGTTIVTFLMAFLIQRAGLKQAEAVGMKLNELIAAVKQADNALINAEDLSEAELQELHVRYAEIRARRPDMSRDTVPPSAPPVVDESAV